MLTYDIIDNHTWEIAPEINAFLADNACVHSAVRHFCLSSFGTIAEAISQEANL